MPRTVAEIDAQIRELNLERNQSMAGENARLEAVIKSLEWTKGCELFITLKALCGEGEPKYTLVPIGPIPRLPENGPVVVYGTSHKFDYANNVLFGRRPRYHTFGPDTSPPCFFTDSEDAIEGFLSQVVFKRVRFDEKYLQVLLAAQKAAKRHEDGLSAVSRDIHDPAESLGGHTPAEFLA